MHDMYPTPKAHPDGIQLANIRSLPGRRNVFDCPNMQTFFSWTAKAIRGVQRGNAQQERRETRSAAQRSFPDQAFRYQANVRSPTVL